MIDGIINNGPKEDKTLDAKAPETGEKSSIMDRLMPNCRLGFIVLQ